MKPPRSRLLALGLLLAATLHAGSRETAFRARAMLGPDVWARVLRIENERPGRDSRYPAEFHGLKVARALYRLDPRPRPVRAMHLDLDGA